MSKWEGTHVKNSVDMRLWPSYQVEATLEEAFNGFPSGDHIPVFPTQLDRDVFEHTPQGADGPMWAHEVWDTCPRHLDPIVIAKRARCTTHEAIQLADALSILDADSKLSNEVCKWAFVRGVESTLHYLHRYLIGIAEAEHHVPAPQCDEEPVIGFQDIRPLWKLTVAELRHECKRREIPAPTRLRRWQLEALLDRADRSEVELEDSEPDTIEYAPMCEGETECDWIDSQAPWFQLLIMSIQETTTQDGLSAIAKSVHKPELHSKLTGNLASVFWTFYKNRKRALNPQTTVGMMPQNIQTNLPTVKISLNDGRAFATLQMSRELNPEMILGQKADEMAERIRAAEPKKIGGIGCKLFQLQKGEIKGPKLNKREWSVVWEAYHERKGAQQIAA